MQMLRSVQFNSSSNKSKMGFCREARDSKRRRRQTLMKGRFRKPLRLVKHLLGLWSNKHHWRRFLRLLRLLSLGQLRSIRRPCLR